MTEEEFTEEYSWELVGFWLSAFTVESSCHTPNEVANAGVRGRFLKETGEKVRKMLARIHKSLQKPTEIPKPTTDEMIEAFAVHVLSLPLDAATAAKQKLRERLNPPAEKKS
jgi:hypothetical protein